MFPHRTWLFLLLLAPFFATAQHNLQAVPGGCNASYDSTLHRTYYKNVDEPASYAGGYDSLVRTLKQQIRYPHAYEDFSGTVWLSFIVEADGRISNIRLIKKVPQSYYNEEAIRAVMHLTAWIPGKCNGVPVPTLQYLPVRFSL